MLLASSRAISRFTLAWVTALALALPACHDENAPIRQVVLISLDTLRADRLGCYGCPRETTPHLDRLAREGIVFRRAYAQSAWTLPSHFALLTSLYPADRRLITYTDPPRGRVPEAAELLPELLHEEGFATAAFTGGGYVSAPFGFDQGFDTFETHGSRIEDNLDPALAWIEAHEDAPFFVFLHGYNTHRPYEAPVAYFQRFFPDYDGRFGDLRFRNEEMAAMRKRIQTPYGRRYLSAWYDAEVCFADEQVQRFLDGLQRLGLADECLVIVTSDHGDELLDHGSLDHVKTLYEEIVHVPLILHGRRIPPGTSVETPVELVDVLPTVLHLTNLALPREHDGHTLIPFLWGKLRQKNWALALTRFDGSLPTLRKHASFPEIVSVVEESWKLIEMRGEKHNRQELYDLTSDPGEHDDIWAENKKLAGELYGHVRGLVRRANDLRTMLDAEEKAVELDEETRQALEELGYGR